MFGIAAFPSIVMFWGLLYLPESPRWLMKKSRAKEAEEVLKRLRGYSSVDKELKQIEESLVNDTSGKMETLIHLFLSVCLPISSVHLPISPTIYKYIYTSVCPFVRFGELMNTI